MGWAACMGGALFNSPEWGGGSSPVKTEPLQIVVVVVIVVVFDATFNNAFISTTSEQ